MGVTFIPGKPTEPKPKPTPSKPTGTVTFTPGPAESNPASPEYDVEKYGPRTTKEQTKFKQDYPELIPPKEPTPSTPVQFLITHAESTEAGRLRSITDTPFDPSKVGVTTESFEARQELEHYFQTQAMLAHQSLTRSEEATFMKRFTQDGQITDTQGALDYLLLYAEPKNISSLQSSIAELEAHPLIIGETSRARLEKEQQEAISGAWKSLTPTEQKEFAELFPESIMKTPEQLAFESERGLILSRITGEPHERVGEMARFVSGSLLRLTDLTAIGGQIFFGGEQKGERILDIMAGQSMAFKGKGVPELFVEGYKPGGFGFTATLAATTFGIGKVTLPVLAGAGTGGAILATGVPLAIGGGFSAVAGASIGYTGAMEQAGLTYEGATAEAAFTYGGHLALFMAGGAIAAKGTPTSFEQNIARNVRAYTQFSKGYLGSRFPIQNIKQLTGDYIGIGRMKLMVKGYPFHSIEGTHAPFGYGLGTKIKTALFEPTTLQYMQKYGGWTKPYLFSKQPYASREVITTREQLPGYRDIGYLMESFRVPTKYFMHQQQIAFQKQMQFRLGAYKSQRMNIKTETQVIVDPKNPMDAFFKTTRVGKDIFSVGEIKQIGQTFGGKISFKPTSAKGIKEILTLDRTAQQGQLATIIGKTYYKLSPIDVFYQSKPFVGFVSSKSLRDIGGYTSTRTYGLTLQDHGVFISRGFTLQKDYFAGESFIEQGPLGGYFKQIEHDMSIALSKGAFRSRLTGGVYEDIMGTLKPKLPGSGEYYGEPGGFDYRLLTKGAIGDLVMPGGVGTQQTVKPLPSIFESAHQKPFTLAQLESLESGIVSSTYWSGVKPQVSSVLVLAPISISSQIKISKTALISKSALGQMQIQTPITIQLQKQTQLQKQSQKQVQIQQQVQLQKQLQLQQTKQVQVQLQKQLVAQMQVQLLLAPALPVSITRMGIPGIPSYTPTPVPSIPPPYPFGLPFPPGDKTIPEKEPGQAFNVLIRERRFFKGKEIKEGKFIKINKLPLSEFGALSLGATATDNSAAKTFKIKKTHGKPKQPTIDVDSWNFLQMKFLKKGERYIEQPFAAIDTPGEVAGISARGWIAKRRKAMRITKPRKIKVTKEIIGFEMPDMVKDFNKLFRRFDFGF